MFCAVKAQYFNLWFLFRFYLSVSVCLPLSFFLSFFLVSGFRIPTGKICWIPDSGFSYMGRHETHLRQVNVISQ